MLVNAGSKHLCIVKHEPCLSEKRAELTEDTACPRSVSQSAGLWSCIGQLIAEMHGLESSCIYTQNVRAPLAEAAVLGTRQHAFVLGKLTWSFIVVA